MSKELRGRNGKIVGSIDYFEKLNVSSGMDCILKKYNFDYYTRLKAKSYKAGKMFDEVYDDLKKNEKYLCYIDKDEKKRTAEIIKGMAGICKIVGDSTSRADTCVSILLNSEKSKSGASDSDITKSARYVLSNRYFRKQAGITLIYSCINEGEKKTVGYDKDRINFISEVKRSSKSGYLEDVVLKVNYLDGGNRIIGKSRKVPCSKEYNNYIANAVIDTSSISGNVDYGRIVSQGLKYIITELQKDLEHGLILGDYILDKNKENLIKFIEDIDRCNTKCYNLIKMVYELAWFVGGDVNKIKRLQATLKRQGYTKVELDGVYGAETEQAWINYVNKTVSKYERYNDVNVWGVGGSVSWASKKKSASKGLMMYIDDDFNILLMSTLGAGVTTDNGISFNDTYEWSRTATTVYDMAGSSVTYEVGVATPIEKVGVSVGHSRSIGDGGAITSNSISGTFSFSDQMVSGSVGISENVIVADFNPKKWVRKKLDIK